LSSIRAWSSLLSPLRTNCASEASGSFSTASVSSFANSFGIVATVSNSPSGRCLTILQDPSGRDPRYCLSGLVVFRALVLVLAGFVGVLIRCNFDFLTGDTAFAMDADVGHWCSPCGLSVQVVYRAPAFGDQVAVDQMDNNGIMTPLPHF